jgi:hypothetical protein
MLLSCEPSMMKLSRFLDKINAGKITADNMRVFYYGELKQGNGVNSVFYGYGIYFCKDDGLRFEIATRRLDCAGALSMME